MDSTITTDDVRKRAEVSKLASRSIERAIAVARTIKHPWYRCQSLTNAAEAHPERVAAIRLVEEAFEAAEEQSEINRIVTVAAWPLRAAVKLAPELAQRKLSQLIALAATEPHGLRRADALSAVLYAVSESPQLKAQALPLLVDTVTSAYGWRIERLIAGIAVLVQHDHPEYLSRLLGAHSENSRKRKLLEALNEAKAA